MLLRMSSSRDLELHWQYIEYFILIFPCASNCWKTYIPILKLNDSFSGFHEMNLDEVIKKCI